MTWLWTLAPAVLLVGAVVVAVGARRVDAAHRDVREAADRLVALEEQADAVRGAAQQLGRRHAAVGEAPVAVGEGTQPTDR